MEGVRRDRGLRRLDVLPGDGVIAESRPGGVCARWSPFACAGILGSTKRVFRPLTVALR
jgi:hypothetical protein